MTAPLTDFFRGRLKVAELKAEAQRRVRNEPGRRIISGQESPTEKYALAAADLIRLCDAAATGGLTEEELSNIAFWIYSADEIDWDEKDEVITTTLMDWSSPQTNFRITPSTLKNFRERLVTGDLSIAIT